MKVEVYDESIVVGNDRASGISAGGGLRCRWLRPKPRTSSPTPRHKSHGDLLSEVGVLTRDSSQNFYSSVCLSMLSYYTRQAVSLSPSSKKRTANFRSSVIMRFLHHPDPGLDLNSFALRIFSEVLTNDLKFSRVTRASLSKVSFPVRRGAISSRLVLKSGYTAKVCHAGSSTPLPHSIHYGSSFSGNLCSFAVKFPCPERHCVA